MDQCIRVSQIVQELVAQAFTFMGTRDKTSDVEKLDWHGPLAIDAGAMIGLTSTRKAETGTSAVYLQIASCSLWVDGREAAARLTRISLCWSNQALTENFLQLLVSLAINSSSA